MVRFFILCLLFFNGTLITSTAQDKIKATTTAIDSGFAARLYLSTSDDPLAIIKVKTMRFQDFPEIPKHMSKLKTAESIVSVIDSTYSYRWIAATQSWVITPYSKEINTYNSNHQITDYIQYSWDKTNNTWVNSIQITYEYATKGKLARIIQSSWQQTEINLYEWINNAQYIYIYNSIGQEDTYLVQEWDTEFDMWINSWQHEFQYDPNGNNTLVLEKTWDINSNQWNVSYQYIYSYDTFRHITKNLVQKLDTLNHKWVNGDQTLYTYDTLGNNTIMLYQYWDSTSNSWINDLRRLYTYFLTNKIEKYNAQLWNNSKQDWVDNNQGLYDYDLNGNNIRFLNQVFDTINNKWIDNWQTSYEYDSYGFDTICATLIWSNQNNIWNSGTKTINYRTAYTFNRIMQSKILLYYIYPNPVLNGFTIAAPSGLRKVTIYDLEGKTLQCKYFNDISSIYLDVSNYKQGIYIININESNGNIVNGKFTKY